MAIDAEPNDTAGQATGTGVRLSIDPFVGVLFTTQFGRVGPVGDDPADFFLWKYTGSAATIQVTGWQTVAPPRSIEVLREGGIVGSSQQFTISADGGSLTYEIRMGMDAYAVEYAEISQRYNAALMTLPGGTTPDDFAIVDALNMFNDGLMMTLELDNVDADMLVVRGKINAAVTMLQGIGAHAAILKEIIEAGQDFNELFRGWEDPRYYLDGVEETGDRAKYVSFSVSGDSDVIVGGSGFTSGTNAWGDVDFRELSYTMEVRVAAASGGGNTIHGTSGNDIHQSEADGIGRAAGDQTG